ncbi:DUF423 domain-containing protein [Sinomicrobium weinanense]|uniref:DUF423 domain-containing protein n=1 Tax=Sinomicrobium weinanense TaxID=2842200 RepID=A0A926JUI4_9FLAO|nr:DUF423 domain-containing protein [Sinomicrobium weinanense]MBC9797436.1 DUF423 domain-containing protein [Sinomicrobium weinanense]MBU3125454.1 DUF423 domain-containing protein [Sinomicrobium weinanense]
MKKTIFCTAALFGFLAVVLGAFGAHALKEAIGKEAIGTFETGVKYQMYHALLLLFIGNLAVLPEKSKKILFWLISVGIILFSGSIYALATNNLSSFDFRTIGIVTPIGGTLLIVAWAVLFYNFLRVKTK